VIGGQMEPRATPTLGNANEEVLGGWLGLTRSGLDDLHERGIV
jgi:hypothetical protein